MTYENLATVNSQIKTTPIKGKQYAEVNERIIAFRKLFPEGTISTEIVGHEGGMVIIKATVRNEQGAILGTGHAYEKEGSSQINRTSYIENAETSAVGRALGMVGFGIGTSIASYEEVANAQAQQASEAKQEKKREEKPATAGATAAEKKPLSEEDIKARNAFIATCKKYSLDTASVAAGFNLDNSSTAMAFYDAVEKIEGGKA